MKEIMLCAICNVSSGACKEDCAFCAQSLKYKANINRYYKKDLNQILKEAKIAKQNQALGFCLVTAGKGISEDEKMFEYILKTATKIKQEVEIMLIASCGTATKKQLEELKKAGVDSYNHNLETSESFYNQICTSHDWQERYETNVYAKEAKLMLCCGGIFGVGESQKQRIEFFDSLSKLEPFSSPMNFYIPNESLPLQKILDTKEALEILKLARNKLPNSRLMVAGGKEVMFSKDYKAMFDTGIDAVVIGDYLTTKGEDANKQIQIINNLGLRIAKYCHE